MSWVGPRGSRDAAIDAAPPIAAHIARAAARTRRALGTRLAVLWVPGSLFVLFLAGGAGIIASIFASSNNDVIGQNDVVHRYAVPGMYLSPSPLVAVGVVGTPDAVLVLPRARAQEVKDLVAALKSAGYPEASSHRRIHRPWGSYEAVDVGERFQVKRLIVRPGAALSLQKHMHRAEHLVVVRGTAEVTIDGEQRVIHENESTYIPLGAVHRLANPGKLPLELIEVQTGSYLGEDDIVRLDDVYGRG